MATSLPALLAPQIESWVPNNHLEQIAWADVLGAEFPILTRAQAMQVPAVARARHLICSAIAKLPLRVLVGDVEVPDQPGWCQATDGQLGDTRGGVGQGQSPWWRMLWTVDDHLFYGHALWMSTAEDAEGRPRRMVRVPVDEWTIRDDDGVIVDADGRPFTRPVFYMPGPHEGILTFARRTIDAAARLEAAAADIAERPFRLELHQTTDVTLDPAERRAIVSEARSALKANDGILFTNAALETKDHKLDSGQLLIEGRNAAAVDVARHVSMPATLLDATTPGSSLTYVTVDAQNRHWITYGLSLYLDPITARLGMDDVVPRGQRVAFDTAELLEPVASPTGPATTD